LPKVIAVHTSPQHQAAIEKEVNEVARSMGTSIEIAHEGEKLTL
jgi:hypothetical protein